MICKLDLADWRRIDPTCVLEMFTLPSIPRLRAIFEDAALKQQCVAETIWITCESEPTEGLCKSFQDPGQWGWRADFGYQDKPCKFPRLLKLTPTILGRWGWWLALFAGASL